MTVISSIPIGLSRLIFQVDLYLNIFFTIVSRACNIQSQKTHRIHSHQRSVDSTRTTDEQTDVLAENNKPTNVQLTTWLNAESLIYSSGQLTQVYFIRSFNDCKTAQLLTYEATVAITRILTLTIIINLILPLNSIEAPDNNKHWSV